MEIFCEYDLRPLQIPHTDGGGQGAFAAFDAAYDVESGTIFALRLWSLLAIVSAAAADATADPADCTMPGLKTWSDVTFLTWGNYARQNVKQIKRIIRGSI